MGSFADTISILFSKQYFKISEIKKKNIKDCEIIDFAFLNKIFAHYRLIFSLFFLESLHVY